MPVGIRFKEIREKLGLSQTEFAAKIGVSKQTLYKYENDIITNIPSNVIEKVAKYGNVHPSYLMGWDDEVHTAAAHLDSKDFTEDEWEAVTKFAAFVKEQNKAE